MLTEIDANTSVDFEQWVEDVDQRGVPQFPDTEEGSIRVITPVRFEVPRKLKSMPYRGGLVVSTR